MLTHLALPLLLLRCRDFFYVGLTGPQSDQSLIAAIGDSDNSLSMRWVKLGSRGSMNQADGAGGGRHVAATG
jgi:hypothetical protein